MPTAVSWSLAECTYSLRLQTGEESLVYWADNFVFKRVSECCTAQVGRMSQDPEDRCCVKCGERVPADWKESQASTPLELLAQWQLPLDVFGELAFACILETHQSLMYDWWQKFDLGENDRASEILAYREFEKLESALNAELAEILELSFSL